MRTETEIVIGADSPWAGTPCTRCGQALAEGDRAVICPRCRAPHHSRCGMENGGCARTGCRQVAVAVVLPASERPRSAAPPPLPWWRQPAVIGGIGLVVAVGLWLVVTAARPASAPVATLRVMTWAGLEEADALEELAAEFEADHPGVDVRLDLTPTLAYDQKLIILIAARDAPDVYALAPERVELFARQGALLDLTPRWEQAPPDLRQAPWSPRLDEATVDGRLWGLPHPFTRGALVISSQSQVPDLAWEWIVRVMRRLPPATSPPEVPQPSLPGGLPIGVPGS
ncbi:MAG: extracellular solute-binding protein [Firmicutes bacterium]|nr:extracellular solute-binding protein [Bacillota bacterium]